MPGGRTERAAEFLQQIGDPAHPILGAENVAVIVAHPDDETIGCGALLHRLPGVRVIVITDGAPRNLADAHAHGFATAMAYTEARTTELHRAVCVADISPDRVMLLGIPDQQAVRNLEFVIDELGRLFSHYGIHVVLTHAYEGGHPDHDAAAFCVHQAASSNTHSIGIVEMPYYRAADTGAVQQSFAPGGDAPIVLALNEKGRRLKRQMIAEYKTQANVLAGFSLETEQFRIAPDYDFMQLPNGGRVLYECESWGVTGQDWLHAVNAYFAREAAA